MKFKTIKCSTKESKTAIRYFKTPYINLKGSRLSLNYNTLGNFISIDFVRNAIYGASDSQVLSISDTEEITKQEFDNLDMSLLDSNRCN